MKDTFKFYLEVFKKTFKSYTDSNVFIESAGLAYSALFSIPGLLIIIIWSAGAFFGEKVVRGEISNQIEMALDRDAARSIQKIIEKAMIDQDGILMKTVGVMTLIFGATTLFFMLQKSLNNLWGIETQPNQAIKKYVMDRINSLVVILIIGLLMVVSMILSTVLSSLNEFITTEFGAETYQMAQIINLGVGFLLVAAIFAIIFKILPDVEIPWKAVYTGALVTAVLFTLGKFLLGYYFENFEPASAYGAAGTVVLIMIWINYSFLIIFFGAEFTKIHAMEKGYKFKPSDHAVWKSQEYANLGKGATSE
ncbi:YihY family inner membrane protein [Flavobacteriaceae bacterium Ap0902]|nr:YihY family inner membrane protein [Flavobacteriaceae bacterium Ap0902]